jgi:hypothetical protein
MTEPMGTDGHGQVMLHCPICGVSCLSSNATGHRCRPETLRAIDRALATDRTTIHNPTLAERLKDGFAMIGDDDAGN